MVPSLEKAKSDGLEAWTLWLKEGLTQMTGDNKGMDGLGAEDIVHDGKGLLSMRRLFPS